MSLIFVGDHMLTWAAVAGHRVERQESVQQKKTFHFSDSITTSFLNDPPVETQASQEPILVLVETILACNFFRAVVQSGCLSSVQ